MLERWKPAADKVKYVEAILTDLSKVFECLPHDLSLSFSLSLSLSLSLAKIYAYGLNKKVLRLIQSCLSNRKQLTKVNVSFSSWVSLKAQLWSFTLQHILM